MLAYRYWPTEDLQPTQPTIYMPWLIYFHAPRPPQALTAKS